MKRVLLSWLACPRCGGAIAAPPGDEAEEILRGQLTCASCGAVYPVREGVPVLLAEAAVTQARTRELYSDLWTSFTPGWRRSEGRSRGYSAPARNHLQLLCLAAGADAIEGGSALDAGCGNGVSVSAAAAAHPETEVVGIDLSEGPLLAAASPAKPRNAHFVQGDLLDLPFAPESFDSAFSFGVLHHTPDPEGAFRKLLGALRPGSPITLFLYKDFSDLPIKRLLLVPVSQLRRLTTRLSPRTLRALAWLLAPVVFLSLTLPARALRSLGLARLSRHVPYATFPDLAAVASSLEDRFGAPHEHRFSKGALEAWARRAALVEARVVDGIDFGFSGLVLRGRKPGKAPGKAPGIGAGPPCA